MTTQTVNYGSQTAIALSIASLGSSSTFVAGRESDEIDNSSNKFVDAQVRGKVRVGTSPTANTQILIYLWGSDESLTTDPLDTLDGVDSAETLTSVGVGAGFLKLAKALQVDSTTSDRDYFFGLDSVAQYFGGNLPKFWGVFLAHNTGVNLNSTGGNHEFFYTGIKYDFA